jgi:UDPglucose 6-dehydrogenase
MFAKMAEIATGEANRYSIYMKLTIVGTGYVGLVTGSCFAEAGNTVTCVDIDKEKVSLMRSGKIPIYEPNLENLFKRGVSEKRLFFTTSLEEGIKDAEVIFLALPTPPGKDSRADLSYVLQAAGDLGLLLKKYVVVVDKSTVPVGTAESVREIIAKISKVDFDVVSNPEFLREGFAVSDFMRPSRVVIGTSSLRAMKIMEELYRPFVVDGEPMIFMDERSAEMTKYAANAFLATKISFMNEIANICERCGADVDSVRAGIGSDERIGNRFLLPGIGYGGSCFPKDVNALIQTANDYNYFFRILSAVNEVNVIQKRLLVEKVKRYFPQGIEGRTFALWGLSFKPDTDDIREAPAIEIISELVAAGARVRVFDPVAGHNVAKMFHSEPSLVLAESQYDAINGVDALLIATEWLEFQEPDFAQMKKLMNKQVIFDGRNIYSPNKMKEEGFYYESIGRQHG